MDTVVRKKDDGLKRGRAATGDLGGSMLHVTGVSKAFGAFRVLREVELDAAAGAITGIIGPNGAGKSTLLYVIGGLIKPDAGQIVLDGVDITSVVPYKRALCGLVRTFQISRELGELTVLENLLFARPNQTGESVWKAFAFPGRVRREERAAADRAHAILERVGLWRLADQPARGLSGGQKKLLELCRALMLDPKVILLDEPAAGVSPPMRAEISRVIRALCDEGITFVIVEHDMDMVAGICERVYVFAEGSNLTCGSFKQIVSDRRVVDAYLGGLQ
jgi:ABC-type branched-subunit amino acid transport system ATPase component